MKRAGRSLLSPPITETEDAVLLTLVERWKIGRERYKVGISYKQGNDPLVWVQQAIEEAADQLQYLVALKLLLQKGRKK
jgi:hypothetical protein